MNLFNSSVLALVFALGISGILAFNFEPQDSSLVQLESLSGGDFCSEGGVKDAEETLGLSSTVTKKVSDRSISFESDPKAQRAIVVSKFDTEETSCLDMDFISASIRSGLTLQTNVISNAGSIEIDGRRLPLIISRLEADNSAGRSYGNGQTIYVGVGGGPGSVNITGQTDDLVEYFEGDYLIDFYYTGHGFNIVHPDPSFEIAYTQLATFLEQLRSRNPESKIVVLGTSLGSVLSLEAIRVADRANRSSRPVADKLVLLSPPFGSLDRTAQLLKELQVAEGAQNLKYQYRVRDMGQSYNNYGELVVLDAMDVFTSLYQERHGEIDLLERVKSVSRSLPILVIYGDADVRIDQEKADAFASQEISNVSVIRLPGMRHQPTKLDDITSIQEELGYFVDE